jgi:hypothetical protein
MPINVFLSVGRTFAPAQEQFVAKFERLLAERGLTTQTVGRSVSTYRKPLVAIDRLMRRCAGAVIIAFERIRINSGAEKRGSPEEMALSDIDIATPWNQIEAAFAYSLRLPLFVMKERSVRGDGLLEEGNDWYVHAIDLSLDSLDRPEFRGAVDEWRRDVRARALRKGWFPVRS